MRNGADGTQAGGLETGTGGGCGGGDSLSEAGPRRVPHDAHHLEGMESMEGMLSECPLDAL